MTVARIVVTALGLLVANSCSERRNEPLLDATLVMVPDGGRPSDAASQDVATSTPLPRFDLSFTLPFDGAEQTAEITAAATPGRVDVHLLVDTTASFAGEIDELQRELLTTVLPGLRARVPSLTLGVSAFQDLPYAPFGETGDVPFRLVSAQTSDGPYVGGAVARLDMPLGRGGDRAESWLEALYQVGTGEGLRGAAGGSLITAFSPSTLPDTGALGGAGFRRDSTRVIVLVTDAPSHTNGEYRALAPAAHSREQVLGALDALDAQVVGIVSAADVRGEIESVVAATGAQIDAVADRCATGLGGAARPANAGRCPLVYDLSADGTGLSRTVVDGIAALLDNALYAAVAGEAIDDPHALVRAVEAVRAEPRAGTTAPTREDRRPELARDGIVDTFVGVRGDTKLTFRLRMRNTTVAPAPFPQVIYLRIAIASEQGPLRELRVRVIVPESPKYPGDAGLDVAAADGPSDAALLDAATPD